MLHDIAKHTPLVPAPEVPQPSLLTTTTTTIPRGFSFGRINITLVDTQSTSCHLVAVGVREGVYGWVRNEYYQLGYLPSSLSSSEGVREESTNNNTMITLPRLLTGTFVTDSIPVVGAATRKGHTILIDVRGDAYACILNNLGQCGINHAL